MWKWYKLKKLRLNFLIFVFFNQIYNINIYDNNNFIKPLFLGLIYTDHSNFRERNWDHLRVAELSCLGLAAELITITKEAEACCKTKQTNRIHFIHAKIIRLTSREQEVTLYRGITTIRPSFFQLPLPVRSRPWCQPSVPLGSYLSLRNEKKIDLTSCVSLHFIPRSQSQRQGTSILYNFCSLAYSQELVQNEREAHSKTATTVFEPALRWWAQRAAGQ